MSYARYIQRQMCVYARTLIVSRDSLFLNTSRLPAVTMSDGRAFHIRVTLGKNLCIWHTEPGCIAFPRIIRLQMISSRDVYKIVGDAKLHRQTGLGSSFMQSIPTDLLEQSSGATGAAEVVAGVSGIPAFHHLQLVYVCFRVWVPDSASVFHNYLSRRIPPVFDLPGDFRLPPRVNSTARQPTSRQWHSWNDP